MVHYQSVRVLESFQTEAFSPQIDYQPVALWVTNVILVYIIIVRIMLIDRSATATSSAGVMRQKGGVKRELRHITKH